MAEFQVTGGGSEVRILTLVDAITLSNIYGSPSQDPENPTVVSPEAAGRALYSIVSRSGEIAGAPSGEDESISVSAGAGDVLLWRMTSLSLNQGIVAEIDAFTLFDVSPTVEGPYSREGESQDPWLLAFPLRTAKASLEFRVEDNGSLFGYFLWKPQLALVPPAHSEGGIVSPVRAGSAAA